MPGEKAGYSPEEEITDVPIEKEWLKEDGTKGQKTGAEASSRPNAEVIQFPKIEAKSGEEEIAEGEAEKKFFKKTG